MKKNYLNKAFGLASAILLIANFAFGQTPIVVQATDGVLGGDPLPTIQPCPACDSGSKIGSNENNGIKNTGWATYTVNVPTGGLYKLDVYYSAGWSDTFFEIQVNNNAFSYRPYPKSTGDWETIGSVQSYITLSAGVNTIKFWNSYWVAPNLSKFVLTKATNLVSELEAETATLGGTASVDDNTALSAGKGVEGNIHGLAGWITFTVNVPTAGQYTLAATYNDASNDGDRYFKIIVNQPITTTGGKIDNTGVDFGVKKGSGPNGCSTDQYQKIDLVAGENKVTFYSDWYAPRLDRILILDTEGVLPVSLTKFTAKIVNSATELNWTTASERNSASFAIMRSGDDQVFTKIGEVAAAGNSNGIINYSFKDLSPLSGNSYYQLYQYDIDGSVNKSAVTAVFTSLASNNADIVLTSSNNDVVEVNVNIPSATTGTATISNINGQVFSKQNFVLDNGKAQISLPVKGGAGIYIVSIDTPQATLRKKFFKN